MQKPEKVLDFRLTDHFMLRGWDRSIDKFVLCKLLCHVKASDADKKLVVITPAFYESKGIKGRENHCLVLVLKQDLIKTGYWCKNPNYLFTKEEKAEFQWLYI